LTPPEHEIKELVAGTRDEDVVVGFLSGVLRPDSPGYQTGVYALVRRCQASRGAPQRYVPLLRPLLADGVNVWIDAVMPAVRQ
jgi:hypothetical protein